MSFDEIIVQAIKTWSEPHYQPQTTTVATSETSTTQSTSTHQPIQPDTSQHQPHLVPNNNLAFLIANFNVDVNTFILITVTAIIIAIITYFISCWTKTKRQTNATYNANHISLRSSSLKELRTHFSPSVLGEHDGRQSS